MKRNRVTLTSITEDDLPVLFAWINNREQVLFNAPYKPVSYLQHQAWFKSIQEKDDTVIFGIKLVKTNKLIGSCQLHNINYIHRSAELQIRLGDSSKWGEGYGTEAVRLLLDFGFKDLNLDRVHLHVLGTNTRAIRVYEKVGFVHEGILRKAAFIGGANIDVVVMGILKEEYVR